MHKIYVLAAIICAAPMAPLVHASDSVDAHAKVNNLVSELKVQDGSYNYQFETTNGIAAQESGVGGYYAAGSSQYYTPEGQLIQLTYTADENGFQPHGDHLPTPPPIPDYILKSLEWIRTHPHENDEAAPYEHGQEKAHLYNVAGHGAAHPQSGPYNKKI